MAKYVCPICGYVYDEEKEGVKFSDLPSDYTCPVCGAPIDLFTKEEEEVSASEDADLKESDADELKELSFAEMSIICSNLAKACEKQVKNDAAKILYHLADKYLAQAEKEEAAGISAAIDLIANDVNLYPSAKKKASENHDRGSLRALVWSEKVTRMMESILGQYLKKGDALLNDVNIYVCEVCGFIYIGNDLPPVCPVCKVPNFKMRKVEVI